MNNVAGEEPYKAGLIKKSPFKAKKELRGRLVAILDIVIEQRGMRLIEPMSRALPKGTICEIAMTDEDAGPGKIVNHVGYVGFVELEEGGVAVVGDLVSIGGKPIGTIAGFDETHAPNHITLLLRAGEVSTGGQLGLEIGDEVRITMPPREGG